MEQASAAMLLPSKAPLLHSASSVNGVTAKPDACHRCSCTVDQCAWCIRRSAVRATCRCLRNAFDAVSPCLTLGGRKVLEFPTSWLLAERSQPLGLPEPRPGHCPAEGVLPQRLPEAPHAALQPMVPATARRAVGRRYKHDGQERGPGRVAALAHADLPGRPNRRQSLGGTARLCRAAPAVPGPL